MKILFAGLALLGCAALSLWLWATPQHDARFDALAERLRELDDASPGQLGVYLLRPADGSELNHNADRTWYLASATKAAIAIAVLQIGQRCLPRSTRDSDSPSSSSAISSPGVRLTVALQRSLGGRL